MNKIMKKTIKIFAVALLPIAAAALSACSNFLEEEAKGSLTEEEAYATKTDILNNGVLAMYNRRGYSADTCIRLVRWRILGDAVHTHLDSRNSINERHVGLSLSGSDALQQIHREN